MSYIDRLDELRKFIEKRIVELEREIQLWKICLRLVEKKLRVKEKGIEVEIRERMTREEELRKAVKLEETKKPSLEILDNRGRVIAQIFEYGNTMKIVPDEHVKVNINSKEFRQFFIGKVLAGIKKENPRFSYNIIEKKGLLVQIVVKGVVSERERKRIYGAIKWTFSKFIT